MNIYLLLPLIQALFSLSLAVVVLKGHTRSFVHRLFFLFLLSQCIWAIMIFGMRASPDIEHAYLWERWLVILAPLTAVLFYHFAIRYTAARINTWLLGLLYIIAFLFTPLSAVHLIVDGMQIKPYGYAPVFGPAMPFLLTFNYVLFAMSFLVFTRAYRTSSSDDQKNRVAYIIAAMSISLLGAVFDILPVFGLPLYPGYIISNIIFCVLTATTILRHNLLDIRVVLRKSLTYILMSTLIALPFIGVFLLFTKVSVEGSVPLWAYILFLLILALTLPQLWGKVQQWVNKMFYRDRYNYLRALESFSKDTQSLKNSEKLNHIMVNLITGALQPSTVCLLQPAQYSGDFTIVSSANISGHATNFVLRRRSPIIKWIKRSEGILNYQDLDIIPQLQSVSVKEREALKQFGARLIAPLKTGEDQLLGVLILGEKLSEQPYTIEDKQLIYTVCRQMITSLENARLYNDVLRVRENLEKWLNSMTDCIMIVDTDYKIQFLNYAAIIQFSAKSDEMCWKGLGQDTKCSNCPMPRYLHGSTKGCQHVRTIGDRQFDLAIAPLNNPNGTISIIEVLRDITEYKRTEIALRQSEGFNSGLLTNSPNPILVIDADASIKYVNPAFEKLTSFSSKELIGRKPPYPWWLEGSHEECSRKLMRELRRGARKYEQLFQKKNGEQFWVEKNCKTVKMDREFRYYLENWVDLTERKRLKENMEFYISQVTRVQEEERKRVSREIHDEWVQSLAAMSLEIDGIVGKNKSVPKDVTQRLQKLRTNLSSIIVGLRRVSHELRPGIMDQMGLLPSLGILTEELNKERINTSLEVIGSERRLTPEAELVLFRITQEALRNIRKHSGATYAIVRLRFARTKVILTISDNGRGFKLPELLGDFVAKGKLGIIGMQERARLLNSELLVKSYIGKGTMVGVEIRDKKLDKSRVV